LGFLLLLCAMLAIRRNGGQKMVYKRIFIVHFVKSAAMVAQNKAELLNKILILLSSSAWGR